MIKKRIVVFLILIMNMMNAQDHKEYSKIKFIFESSPNYFFSEEGIVGNLELLKKEFPLETIVLIESDTIKKGFIAYKQITELNKESIKVFLTHHSEIIVGEYDKATNRTSIKVFRNDTKASKGAKKYLNLEVNAVDSQGYIDYNKKIFSQGNVNYNYQKKFKEINFNIDFVSKSKGFFQFINSKKTKCEVELSEDLPIYVTPNILFANANYGVKRFSNIYSTVTLMSVSYE